MPEDVAEDLAGLPSDLRGGLMVRRSLPEAASGEKGASARHLRNGGQAAEKAAKIGETGRALRNLRFAHNVYYGK